jgi:hypothetical protein
MSEALGVVHILIGLALLLLAILIPARATNLKGGLTLAALFLIGAVERFYLGYYRLVDADLRSDGPARNVLLWSSINLVALLVLLYIAARSPVQVSTESQLDRMEKAAQRDREGAQDDREGAQSDRVGAQYDRIGAQSDRERAQNDREGAQSDREDAQIDQAAGRDHRQNAKPAGD